MISNRTSRVLLALSAVVVLAVSPMAASATGRGDPRREREQVRERQAEVAAEVDVLRGEQADVEAALDAIEANVAGQRASVEDARRASNAAVAAAAQALAELDAAERALADQRASLRELAIESYMHPDTDGGFEMLDSGDLSEAVQRRALLEFRAGRDADAIDRMRAAEEDLGIAREAADAAAARATEQQAALESRLSELEASEAQHEQLAAQVSSRVEASLAEAANLATLDSQLANQIAEENRRLAARVPSAGGGGGRIPISGNLNIVSVRGIQVNADIADELDDMLGAAASAGLSLAGGGYRDPADQLRLREQNCPDPWSSPPSACSPPTARPGQSLHEQGLAIDFTCSGALIKSRSNECFEWLAGHAASYGFYNLPSEPWHWSVDGN